MQHVRSNETAWDWVVIGCAKGEMQHLICVDGVFRHTIGPLFLKFVICKPLLCLMRLGGMSSYYH